MDAIAFEFDFGKQRKNLKNMEKLAIEHHVRFPDGVKETEIAYTHRPLTLVRGKPVSAGQAMQLITGEEPLFKEVSGCESGWDPRKSSGVLGDIFYRSVYNGLSGWVYTDGTIGGNFICFEMYPEPDEILPQYFHLAQTYPFLDLVISYTTYNESCCYWCSAIEEDKECLGDCDDSSKCRCQDCKPYVDKIIYYRNKDYDSQADFEEQYFRCWDGDHVRSDTGEAVRITIWIHNGETDILFGTHAMEKFNEYNKLYCAPEYDFMFSTDLYNYSKNCICDKAYVEACFEFIGKPKSLCDEYIERGFIAPFNENATVITKEWITNQYNTYIKKSAN